MYADDTIAAIATPQGQGGVGIVRVSGPLSVCIAGTVFSRDHRPDEWASHHLYHGQILDLVGSVLDEGLAVLMHAPRSYTGEDVLELHCHGSPVVLRRVLASVLACGARLAEPGEFTKRAFLNGRLDLAQAEAVIDLVRARSDAGAALAAQQLSGGLSAALGELRTQLIRLKALLEAQIDFSEEDFEVDPNELLAVSDHCLACINDLLDTYQHGLLMRDGLRVAIVGKPNVGKSSLLNALLGEDRAIVTPIAGTTRDSIEEVADFEGIPVVLSDTAGLRDRAGAEPLERLGIERTTAKISESQLLLTVIDASRHLDAQDHAVLNTAGPLHRVIVLNKIDLDRRISDDDIQAVANGYPIVAVSAKERIGLAHLRRSVVAEATEGKAVESGPILTNLRHQDALQKASASLQLAGQSIRDGRPADLVAVDVQDAIDRVGEVTGVVTNEDVLDRIFSEFCVGK